MTLIDLPTLNAVADASDLKRDLDRGLLTQAEYDRLNQPQTYTAQCVIVQFEPVPDVEDWTNSLFPRLADAVLNNARYTKE